MEVRCGGSPEILQNRRRFARSGANSKQRRISARNPETTSSNSIREFLKFLLP